MHVTKICHLIFPLPFVKLTRTFGELDSFPATLCSRNVLEECFVSLSGDVFPSKCSPRVSNVPLGRRFILKSLPGSAGLWLGDAAAGEFGGFVGREDAGFQEAGDGPVGFRGVLSEEHNAPRGSFPDVGMGGKFLFRERP